MKARNSLIFQSIGLWLAVACPATAQPLPPTHADDFTGKPRVVVLTDMGNELAVTDNGSPALTSYRRVILNVRAAGN